jgi:hypothetical protein
LGKRIWENDTKHELIQHPYVFKANNFCGLEIALNKRLLDSNEYKDLVAILFNETVRMIPDCKTIRIDVTFRETLEPLAKLEYLLELEQINYKDEHMDSGKYFSFEEWLDNKDI